MKQLATKFIATALVSAFVLTACQPKKSDSANDKNWNPEDYKAVKAAISDYVEGLYLVDSTRIERSVDSTLRKIGYYYYKPRKTWVDNSGMTYNQLVSLAARWNKKGDQINENSPKKIEIYDINSKTATAKLTAQWGIDYFHLGKYNDRWKIINVMWQSMPQETEDVTK